MKIWFTAVCLFGPVLVSAQTLAKVEIEDRVAVHQEIMVRIDFEPAEKVWCGLRVNFGDGDGRDERAEQAPLNLKKSFTRPGVYTISVEGKTLVRGLKTAFACQGSVTSRQLTVFDPQAEEAARQADLERQRKADELAAREARVRAAEEAARIKAAEDAAKRRADEQKPRASVAAPVPVPQPTKTAKPPPARPITGETKPPTNPAAPASAGRVRPI
jgi:hypothetical protein